MREVCAEVTASIQDYTYLPLGYELVSLLPAFPHLQPFIIKLVVVFSEDGFHYFGLLSAAVTKHLSLDNSFDPQFWRLASPKTWCWH